jgi:2-desacetyl-2-hydroxyethyl bacteriochlorophyllide A dehydrogenase
MANNEGLRGQALVAKKGGDFALEEVITAPVGPTDIAVRIARSGVSIGTEFAVLRGKLDWGSFPIVTGYMATGEVIGVGDLVTAYHVGDRVYVRQANGLSLVRDGTPLNCRFGTHSSVAVLDPSGDHGAAHLPQGVSLDVGAMFVMPAVGLYGVDRAGVTVGSRVVVIGLGLIGLGVVGAAARRGAVVIGIDPREPCQAIAREFGAAEVFGTAVAEATDAVGSVLELTEGRGADYVFESTGRRDCIDPAIKMCAPFGCLVWQGNYGIGQIHFNFLEAHYRSVRMVFPCDDGFRPFREASLHAVTMGAMEWERVITHHLSHGEVAAFYSEVFRGGGRDVIGAVVDWSGTPHREN